MHMMGIGILMIIGSHQARGATVFAVLPPTKVLVLTTVMRHTARTCVFSFHTVSSNALALLAHKNHVRRRKRKKATCFDGEFDNFQ